MFRRRSVFRANPLTADQMTVLVKANHLVALGKPLEAGPLFTTMADTLQRTNHPRRAANLYTRAAHAYADGNQPQVALTYARQALLLFIQAGMAGRAGTFYTNITHKMVAKNMQAQASELQREYGNQIATFPARPRTARQTAHSILPTNCPKCGAPIHAEEITWVDENTIECDYCGVVIRGAG